MSAGLRAAIIAVLELPPEHSHYIIIIIIYRRLNGNSYIIVDIIVINIKQHRIRIFLTETWTFADFLYLSVLNTNVNELKW